MSDAYVMVVNGNAGSAADERVDAAAEVLRRRGEVEVRRTEDPDDYDAAVAELDGRRLVVCGGDGSVHFAAERLRAAGRLDTVALSLIPLGTGNDLARSLGIPLEPDDAAQVVLDGAPRRLDLIESGEGDLAVNALHAGIGVDAAARAQALKERLGDMAYPLGAIAAGVAADGWDIEVEVDGERLVPELDGPALLVAVLNGPCVGGGTAMAPGAAPDDGALDVVVTTATGPARRAAFGVALQRGTHLGRDDVAFARGSRIRIHGAPIAYNVDGELDEEEVTERIFEVRPEAWSIVTPRDR